MTENEFITKAKELGYSDEVIEGIVKTHDNAERVGIKILWEIDLIKLPISN
jgi:hypothetical protein